MDVADWLRGLGLEQYEAAFRENDVGADLLPSLTAEDLKDLGVIPVGHRRRMLEAIAALRAGSVFGGAPTEVPPPAGSADRNRSPESAAERRQLSVMFCDLVGSTELSARLDPEDLGAVIRIYQARVAEIVARSGGFIGHYVGDGVLIYFGWPEAREADTERAVRAALAVMAAVSGAPVQGERLQVRIGIATGLVVVGERIGTGNAGEQTAIGETPNRAARLQAVAEPNGVVIDAATRQQIGRLFEFRDMGNFELKGLQEPVHAWAVLGESEVQSRFEALRGIDGTDLVGRSEEMALLLRRWQQATTGTGRVVLVTGEPGIGKSRLVAALEDRLCAEPHVRLRRFCSPHHQDSALYPVITQLERACGFLHADLAAEKLARLEALLAQSEASAEEIALIAALLSIPTDERYPLPQTSPPKRREKTLAALLAQLPRLATVQPVLLIYEDVHWIDPTSLELLARTVERVASLPVLLLITARPEFRPPWLEASHVTTLELNRLNRADGAAVVDRVTGGRALPDAALEQILARTDGIPLFVEELTKTLLESGLLLEEQGRFVLPGPLLPLTIPATLQDSLLARLDRLGTAREVAQIGAVIGRSFTHEMVATLCDRPQPTVAVALDQLVASGLAFRRGVAPELTYTFKHALVQSAAYESLLKSRRAAIHARAVDVLLAQERGIEETQPDVLAWHCDQAGLAQRAVEYYSRAVWQSLARGAFVEAEAQFGNARRLIETLPESEVRDQAELRALGGIAVVVEHRTGWGSAELGRIAARQVELSARLGYPLEYVRSLFTRWIFLINQADLRSALELSTRLLQWSQERGDVRGLIIGHLCAGFSNAMCGDLSPALSHLEEGMRLYASCSNDPTVVWDHKVLSEPEPEWPVRNGNSYLGLVSCWTGYPDRALAHGLAAVNLGGTSPGTAAWLPQQRQAIRVLYRLRIVCFLIEPAELGQLAREVVANNEQGFPHIDAMCAVFEGYAIARCGDPKAGRTVIREGVAAYAATGAVLWSCYFNALLAETYQLEGDAAQALPILTQALDLTERTGERWYAAELHRRIGEAHYQRGDPASAERSFGQALAIARDQGARLWELRAANSFALMLRDQGKREEAHALLSLVYAWFTEGFDTVPLREAKALLDELGDMDAQP